MFNNKKKLFCDYLEELKSDEQDLSDIEEITELYNIEDDKSGISDNEMNFIDYFSSKFFEDEDLKKEQ